MVTKEELQLTYTKLSTMQLLNIVNNADGYTPLAIEVATQELKERQLTPADLENYEAAKTEAFKITVEKNVVHALSFLQKNLFYFIFIPLLSMPFKMNFAQDGYALKRRQSWYYNICGFIGLFLSSFISLPFNLSSWGMLAIWIAFFIPAYLLDDRFNRQYLLKKLTKNNHRER